MNPIVSPLSVLDEKVANIYHSPHSWMAPELVSYFGLGAQLNVNDRVAAELLDLKMQIAQLQKANPYGYSSLTNYFA